MNPEKPGSPLGWRTWLFSIGALTLVIAAALWMRPSNTRTVTFRFADVGTKDPVTNVVVTLIHWHSPRYRKWLLRAFPRLPLQLGQVDVDRTILCVSDTVVVSGIPTTFDGAYALEFKNENYIARRRMFINPNPKGRYTDYIYDTSVERLPDLPSA